MDDTQAEEILKLRVPQVVGVVITKEDERINLCPVTYQAVSTKYEKPLTVCVGLSNDNHTIKTVLKTGEFVYAYPAKEQLREAIYCGTVSGRDTDKIKTTGLRLSPSEHVAPPWLTDGVLSLECRVMHHYNAGVFTIVIGEILQTHASDKPAFDKIYDFDEQQYGVISSYEVLQKGRNISLD